MDQSEDENKFDEIYSKVLNNLCGIKYGIGKGVLMCLLTELIFRDDKPLEELKRCMEKMKSELEDMLHANRS